MAMTLIETVTLTTTASNVGFTNIPQTGADLLVLATHRQQGSINTGVTDSVQFRLNGVNASSNRLFGNGSGAFASYNNTSSGTKFSSPNHNATANVFGNTSIYIPNYKSTTTKNYSLDSVIENNAAASVVEISAGEVATNSPVTAISCVAQTSAGASFSAGCTFYLYLIS